MFLLVRKTGVESSGLVGEGVNVPWMDHDLEAEKQYRIITIQRLSGLVNDRRPLVLLLRGRKADFGRTVIGCLKSDGVKQEDGIDRRFFY